MKIWAPRLYNEYSDTLDALVNHDHQLQRNIPNNIFAAMTLNAGPRTVTLRHTDHLNLAWGWCAITALGHYNPRTSGHLILWDLKMAIEFPPGSTILIPSAVLRHSNVALAAGERRYSLTQYTAGGLMRWKTCGFRSLGSFYEAGEAFDQPVTKMWEDGLSKWSTLEELHGEYKNKDQ